MRLLLFPTYTERVNCKLLHTLRVLVLSFGLLIAVFYVTTILYVAHGMEGTGEDAADCGIVFGAAARPVRDGDGNVTDLAAGPGIARRVSAAALLFAQGKLRRLYFTGGSGEKNATSEAQVMKEFAMAIGIPAQSITLEERSRSTWENLLFTRPLTENCHSVIAISDGYHLARIGLIAHIQGWRRMQAYPAENPPNLLFIAKNMLREAVGVDLLVLSLLSR